MQKLPYFNASLLKNKHGDPLFLFHFCSLHIVTHTWAKFGKKSECRFYFRGMTLRDCRVEKLATTRENPSTRVEGEITRAGVLSRSLIV